MKIQGSTERSNTMGATNAVGATKDAAPTTKAGQSVAPAPGGSRATDQIQLSNLAQLAAASDDSPNHVAKLSSLGATVSSGRYQVEAGVLSNSILDASIHISGGNYA